MKYTNKQIAGTLDYGLLNPPVFNKIMRALLAFGGFCMVIFTVGTIASKEPLLLLAVVLSPTVFWSLCGYLLLRERRHKKLIELWSEDAVELDAYTEKVYCEAACARHYHRGILIPIGSKNNQPYILKVKVKYAHQKHTYFSFTRKKTAFDTFFLCNYSYHGKMVAEYGGGKVKVLYSPKYGKVMFLKDEKPKIDETGEIE